MSQDRKFVAVVAENLPEPPENVKQWWIEHPLELQRVLATLCKLSSPELKVWKTIKLGTGIEDANGFRQAIKNAEMRISDWVNDILGKPEFVVTTKAMEVDLVKVAVGELGFKNGARRDQIYDRAKELGLELCPPEVGPQLRLQYKDQPNSERIFIGMEPIRTSGGDLSVFFVLRTDDDLWLYGYYGGPGRVWLAVRQWVFVRPRKCQ